MMDAWVAAHIAADSCPSSREDTIGFWKAVLLITSPLWIVLVVGWFLGKLSFTW